MLFAFLQAYSVKDQQPQKEKMSIDRTKADSVEQKSEMPEVEEAAHPNLKHQEVRRQGGKLFI